MIQISGANLMFLSFVIGFYISITVGFLMIIVVDLKTLDAQTKELQEQMYYLDQQLRRRSN